MKGIVNGRRAAIRMARVVGLLAGIALLAALPTGCKKKPSTVSKADTTLFRNITLIQLRADSIFEMRDTLKLVRGRWNSPGLDSRYEAYRDSAVYRFIEERQDRGEFGTSDNRYYYAPDGVFFFYEDRGEEREPRGSLPAMSRLVQRTVIFGPDGRKTWGRRLVDGVAGEVPDSQVVAIAERSRALVARLSGMTP